MGLFDFLKKEEKKSKTNAPEKEVQKPETFKMFVECNEVPYHDPERDMDVKLCVRADFDFNGKPDEEAAQKAAIESYHATFGAVSGKMKLSEFAKSPYMNTLRNSMMEYMRNKGFDIKYVWIGFASLNKEYNDLIYGNPKL